LLPFDDAGNQVREIARLFPEIDVILGGQTGQVIRERMLGNVLYAQAGYQAGHVGRVDIMYDTVTGRILRKTGGKYPVDEHQPMSADIRKHVQKHIGLVEAQSQKPLGILKGRLSGRRKGPGQTPLQRLICRAIQEQTDTQVAFYVMLGNPILHSGTLTYSDLWRMVPFDSRIGTMHVTIGELKAMLEENANDLKSRDFLGVYGLQYALDPRGARDEHVSNIRLLNGVHPHPRQRITVAAPGMLLASNGGRFRKLREIAERPASRLRMTDATMREAVRRYITRHTPIMAGDYHARDAKK
jgi:2',3'-cyclic-nucleotide 2'-phosphodiesterase (5'-nucleotidase family)